MIKRYYAEDNAGRMLVITDEERCIAFEVDTREEAISMDTSGIDGCETMEEVECQTSREAVDFIHDQFEVLEGIVTINEIMKMC